MLRLTHRRSSSNSAWACNFRQQPSANSSNSLPRPPKTSIAATLESRDSLDRGGGGNRRLVGISAYRIPRPSFPSSERGPFNWQNCRRRTRKNCPRENFRCGSFRPIDSSLAGEKRIIRCTEESFFLSLKHVAIREGGEISTRLTVIEREKRERERKRIFFLWISVG